MDRAKKEALLGTERETTTLNGILSSSLVGKVSL